MLIEKLITIILGLIQSIFGLFKLPDFPASIQSGLNNIISWLNVPIGVIKNYVGSEFLWPLIIIISGYLLIEPIMYISIWFYNKIRGSS